MQRKRNNPASISCAEKHAYYLIISTTSLVLLRDRATMSKALSAHPIESSDTSDLRREEYLNSNGESGMQRNHQDQQNLRGLDIRGAQHWVKIPEEEQSGDAKSNAHKHPVEYGDRRPGDQRHRYPDQVRVPIQRPAFQHVGALTPEPLQNPPERNRYDARVPVDQTRRTTQ